MRIKHHIVWLALCALTACNRLSIKMDLNITGLENGVFIVYDDSGEKVLGENIVGGKCTITGNLDNPGFYQAVFINNEKGRKGNKSCEMYLEPGTYTIRLNKKNKYPDIQSTSKIQQEVSSYYALLDGAHKKGRSARANDSAECLLLSQYSKQNPKSRLITHFMLKQDYMINPKSYKALFDSLNDDMKNSNEGKTINAKLTGILNTLPGAKAPDINGKTFDGRTFAQITAGKKVFLIDFWRAANYISRNNHDIIRAIYDHLNSKGFDVISVSMDKRPLWWTTAVKDDKLPWPQMADLLGSNSPNAQNWNVTSIPTYYIVDANWNILFRDVDVNEIALDVSQYLEKHP